MSIIVNGVKPPKNCGECPCRHESEGAYIDTCQAVNGLKEIDVFAESRPDWCPLGDLPDVHGRLVDADAMMDDICNSINQMTKIGIAVDGNYLWGKLNDALDNAQTIVEPKGDT